MPFESHDVRAGVRAARRIRARAGVLAALAALAGCAPGHAGGFLAPGELAARRVEPADSGGRRTRRADGGFVPAGELRGPRAAERATPLPAGLRGDPAGEVSAAATPGEGAAAPASAPRARARPAAEVAQGRWIRVDGPQPVVPFTPNDEPIGEYIHLFSAVAGVNIILSSDAAVQDVRLTGSVRGLPWHLALEALLDAHGLRPLQGADGVITVVTAQRAAQERDPTVVRLHARYAHELVDAVRDVVTAGSDSSGASVRVIGDPETSQELVVNASPERLAQVRRLVRDFDRQPAQVAVEVRMVSVDRRAQRRLGINYELTALGDSTGVRVTRAGAGAGGGRLALPPARLARLLHATVGLEVFVEAAQQDGMAQMETAPYTATASGRTARIQVGDNRLFLQNSRPIIAGGVVYPDRPGAAGSDGGDPGGAGVDAGGLMEVETGTILDVTPYVDGGLVKMRVEFSRLGGVLSSDGRSISGGNTRLSSEITVRDGQALVIGGFTASSRSEARGGVPLLAGLPALGRLFRVDETSESFRDLILILTPRILPALSPDPERAPVPAHP